jgi:DNA-binding NarL/FixJ family response regulator
MILAHSPVLVGLPAGMIHSDRASSQSAQREGRNTIASRTRHMTLSTLHLPEHRRPSSSEQRIAAPAGLRGCALHGGESRLIALSYPLPRPGSLDRLSDGEAAVVLLALWGHSNAEIARIRAASARTVANQLASAYRKLGGVSRARLAANTNEYTTQATGAKGALCALIEAIYRPDCFEQVWLQSVADAARPLFDQGLGIAAWLVDTTPKGSFVRRVANAGMPTGALAGLLDAAVRAPAFVRAFHGREVCSLRGHLLARDGAALVGLKVIKAYGARDLLAIVARDGDTALAVATLARDGELSDNLAQTRDARIVEHLSAGLRLRAAESEREADTTAPGATEMLLTRRNELRLAATSARPTATMSGLRAEEAWASFTQGHLQLSDSFDSAGRRFMILHANRAEGKSALLSTRQTKIVTMRAAGLCLKEIAHELEVSIGTVALELRKAMSALGLRHASELRT